jgi:hypothetical protein
MCSLLHLGLLARLCQYEIGVRELGRTKVADSFFKSSDPRFVMARVVSSP